MESFDEIGAAIYSLSIGESRRCIQSDSAEVYEDSDDLMDIDSVDAKSREENPCQPEDVHENNQDISHHEEDGNSSFLETLNPTELGARYALMPRKLLKAAPHNLSDCEHDYEFDTSDCNAISTNSRRNSLWNQRNDMQDKEMGAPRAGAASGLNATNSYSPEMANLFGGSPASGPLQIHHHHYYSSSQNEQFNPSTLITNQAVQQLSHRHMGPSTSKPDLGSLSLHREGAEEWARLHNADMGRATFRNMLPSPWDSAAMPAEKTPYILSSYLQLLINLFLSVYALHVVVSMIQAIRADVAHKMEEEANNILVEIASCERSYRENNCSPDLIVPALEKMCARWARCMNQDPLKVGNRSSISAQTIGIILNSLIEPLSFKFLSVATFLIIVVFACNFGFGYIRAKAYYGWYNR